MNISVTSFVALFVCFLLGLAFFMNNVLKGLRFLSSVRFKNKPDYEPPDLL